MTEVFQRESQAARAGSGVGEMGQIDSQLVVGIQEVNPIPPCFPQREIARTRSAAVGFADNVPLEPGNRRAFRAGEEPLDTFRRYMSVYAREQAQCHLSPALISNLEKNWNAASRRA